MKIKSMQPFSKWPQTAHTPDFKERNIPSIQVKCHQNSVRFVYKLMILVTVLDLFASQGARQYTH